MQRRLYIDVAYMALDIFRHSALRYFWYKWLFKCLYVFKYTGVFLRYPYWVNWHIYAQFTCACYYLYYKEQYCLMLFCNHEMHQNSQNLQSQALMSSEQDLQKIGGNIITAILRFMWGILCTFTVRQSWFLPVWIFIMILIKYKTN